MKSNVLKGLLCKDILMLKSYRKSLFMFLLIFVLVSIVQKSFFAILPIMMVLGFGMTALATFSYDEQAKSDKFMLTLPLTKKDMVLSKYILTILFTLFGAVIGIVLTIILNLVMTQSMGNIGEIISIAIGTWFGIALVEGTQIPAIYKWGAERGRMQIFIIFAVVALAIGGIAFLLQAAHINLAAINLAIEKWVILGEILMLALTFILYYVSYRISCHIYLKKEL